MKFEVFFNTACEEEVKCAKETLGFTKPIILPEDQICFEHEDAEKNYDLDSLEIFCAECCGDPEENEEDEWVFDVLAQCRKEHIFIRQLRALFVLYPEFFDAVKASKNRIIGSEINEDLFSLFER